MRSGPDPSLQRSSWARPLCPHYRGTIDLSQSQACYAVCRPLTYLRPVPCRAAALTAVFPWYIHCCNPRLRNGKPLAAAGTRRYSGPCHPCIFDLGLSWRRSSSWPRQHGLTTAPPRNLRSSSASKSRRAASGKKPAIAGRKLSNSIPGTPQAWNNLAIAYEHEGKFDDARKAYEKALELDPKNVLIRQNYDLFKEINDRTQKRRGDR